MTQLAHELEPMSAPPEARTAADWRLFLVPKSDPDAVVSEVAAQLVAAWEKAGRRSVRDLKSALRHQIEPAFGPMRVKDLRPEYIAAWVRCLVDEGRAPKTIRKTVSLLSSVLEEGIRAGAIDTNPVRLLPAGTLPNNRPRDPMRTALETLTAPQVAAVLQAQDQLRTHHWVFWALSLVTGCRFGEVAELRLKDVTERAIHVGRSWDWKAREVVPATKTGIPRYVPVSRFMPAILAASARVTFAAEGRAQEPEDLVAPWVERGPARQWNDRTCNRRWRKDQAALGWEPGASGRPSIKTTRHTFTTIARKAGADAAAVHMITHASEADSRTSARVYTHLDFEDAAKAVERFDAHVAAQMEPHE